MNTPELLSPAGSIAHMHAAFAYGADAVYAGQPRYSLRVRNNAFRDTTDLALAIQQAHALGKRFYLASNIAPHNDKIRSYLRDLEPVIAAGPDALIMSDPGLIMLVRERWPEQAIHLSVQANAVNWASVKFWQQAGLKRVILSRELSLDEIAEIRQRVPEMELEVFVHGALCIAYSGRCLLSGYFNHRDPNQGACTNACRWQYKIAESSENDAGDLIPSTEVQEIDPVLLHQPGRPDEMLPAEEDEHGTYIMNSKDLRAVQHVEKLVALGVQSLKIEGRTKSVYYAARTAQVYRRAIDDAAAGKAFDLSLMDDLEALTQRGYTEGFYNRHPTGEYQAYEAGQRSNAQQLVAMVTGADNSRLMLDSKNHFSTGDELLLMTPRGNHRLRAGDIRDRRGQAIDRVPGSGHSVSIPWPQGTLHGDSQHWMLVRIDRSEDRAHAPGRETNQASSPAG